MTKIGDMRTAVLDLLQEHERDGMLPTSARFLFYELVMRGTVSKQGARPDRYVSAALTDLREDDTVPWEWVVDETRSIEDYTGHQSIMDGVADALPQFVLDPWQGSPPMVITESRSLAGVLRSVVGEYRVRVASTNGSCSGFLHTKVAPTMEPGDRVIYLGDLDLVGDQIEDHTRSVLEDDVGGDLEWERLALTHDQVERHRLPSVVKRATGGTRGAAASTRPGSARLSRSASWSTRCGRELRRCCPSRWTMSMDGSSGSGGRSLNYSTGGHDEQHAQEETEAGA